MNTDDTKTESSFPFDNARRVTEEEHQTFRDALTKQFGLNLRKRGRLFKDDEDKYEPISIRLHPKVLAWAKEEATKREIDYQSVINEALLEKLN